MLSLFLALAEPSGGAQSTAVEEGFIYDQQGTNLANVFNVNSRLFSFQDKRTASVADSSSEFAGAFNWCSDSRFHCVSGPLNVVVPKDLREGVWALAGIRCSTRHVAPAKLAGACISGAIRTSYVFERGRGIVTYRVATDPSAYLLRGAKGLFAND